MLVSRLPLALGLALAAPLALAANPVGVWTGKIVAQMPPIPANATPQQRSMMQQGMSMASKIRFSLNLKADKTLTVAMTGMTMGAPQKPESGKWSQKGNVITTSTVANGRSRVQNLALSADGKTMTVALPGGRGKIVFSR